jgi:FlaA1/EpsC-like NDP-sugar epimerase
MSQKSNIHFDISERKILLRVFDIISVLSLLYLVGLVFDFDYFKINEQNWVWSIVLVVYLSIFATIFELYDLQKANKFEIVIQNIILTSSVTVLFYLLTPFYTPMLPENRLQIVYFFLSINLSLFVWRYAYITLISAPRYFKKVLLLCSTQELDTIVNSLHKSDPNYRVIGFINTDTKNNRPYLREDVKEFSALNLSDVITENLLSEVVIASSEDDAISVVLYNQLLLLLKKGVSIREYTQVYEDITHRVPVQHVDKDFYRYFPFSRSNHNKL